MSSAIALVDANCYVRRESRATDCSACFGMTEPAVPSAVL